MIRLFVRFPVRLLVFLHCFQLHLGCLPVHLSLLLLRLPRLACIFFDTHALSFSRYRPCNTQSDQQRQNSKSFHSEFSFSLHTVPGYTLPREGSTTAQQSRNSGCGVKESESSCSN